MTQFNVVTKEKFLLKPRIIDKMKAAMEMVPNLYTVLAHSDNALGTYLNLDNAPTSNNEFFNVALVFLFFP